MCIALVEAVPTEQGSGGAAQEPLELLGCKSYCDVVDEGAWSPALPSTTFVACTYASLMMLQDLWFLTDDGLCCSCRHGRVVRPGLGVMCSG
jgi:hypothetical protein